MTEFTFVGKTKWCKPYPRQKNKYDKCSMNFYPNPEDLKTLNALKLRGGVKMDEDGMYFIFNRPLSKGDIIVLDDAGREFTGLIGNGSTIQVTVEKYGWDNEHGKGTGVRVVKVQLVDLVVYVKPDTQAQPGLPS